MTDAQTAPVEDGKMQEKDGRDVMVEVRGLRSQFGDRVIHENLDLDLLRGEVLGVVGGSGAGKTVLLNTIIGLKQPEGGTIRLLGHDRADLSSADAADIESTRTAW